MAITATFLPASGLLSVFGDSLDNTVTASRNAAGAVLVNGGAVAVTGGTATVANTSLIQIFGQGGDDALALNEANGALPAANLFGGAGNDVLTGGSGNDQLFGQGDNDILLGKGGADFLFGGDGDDQVFGEAGNDRMIWNPGDDTDLFEGGADIDTAEVNGGNGSESFTLTANGTRVRFDRVDPAPFSLDIGTTENIVVNMNGGDDRFTAGNGLASLIKVTVDGGTGNDTITGGDGDDLLLGGDGNDLITGGRGNDTALLGAGDDTFVWNPGDGSDTVEGQAGADTLEFRGANIAEQIDISANGGRVRFVRDVAAITMDTNDVETIEFHALGGADKITVGDLSGTDVTKVAVDLAGTLGGAAGDGQADTVLTNGTNGDDTVTLSFQNGARVVDGLAAQVVIDHFESGDTLRIATLGGNDVIDASARAPGGPDLAIDGGAGSDTVSYAAASHAMLINLTGQVTTDGIVTDTLSSIENAVGSAFGDIIVSSDAANRIDCRGGSDTVSYDLSAQGQLINLAGGAATDGLFTDTLLSIENAIGSAFDDIIVSSDAANRIDGRGGSDTVSYDLSARGQLINLAGEAATDGIFTDTLLSIENAISTKFSDVMHGNALDNVLDGGAGGSDQINGAGGSDTVSYAFSRRGELINLASQATADGVDSDTLSSIENAIGSAFGDIIVSSDAANRIDGRGGSDTVSYDLSARGQLINLAGGAATDGIFTDTLSSIENAIGSGFGDIIVSSDAANHIDGRGGSDTVSYDLSARGQLINLAGGAATDGIVTDTFFSIENAIGTQFADRIVAGADANRLEGRGGNDTFVFQRGQANGDTVTDFAGNGAGAGDTLEFVGYGPGATFVQLDGTHWQINSGDGFTHETITLQNAAAVHQSDVLFV